MIKKGGAILATFALSLAILYLFLVALAAIPNTAIRNNMARSAVFYNSADPFAHERGSAFRGVQDNYADAILMDISWHMGEGNPFVSAINTRYNDGGKQGELRGFFLSVVEGEGANTDYTRYVHGTAGFIRLLHLFTDTHGVKQVGLIVFLMLAAIVVVILCLNKHYAASICFVLSLILVQAWDMVLSIEYQPAIIISMIMCILYLVFERKSDFSLVLLSVVSGVLISFFDFLTTETMTILMPLVLVIAVRAKEGRLTTFKEGAFLVLKCGVAWGISYVSVFAIKWVAAYFIAGPEVFENALAYVSERMGMDLTEFEDLPDHYFSPIIANLSMLFGIRVRENLALSLGVSVAFLAVLFVIWFFFRAKEQKKAASYILLILGALVLVRYMLLYNHSYAHCFFTYRALCTPILAVLLSVAINLKGGK